VLGIIWRQAFEEGREIGKVDVNESKEAAEEGRYEKELG
jgi:hypothetical protein